MATIEKLKNAYNDWDEIREKINEIIDNGGGGGGGTDAVWGRIEGNIQAQSDLMAVFSTKATKTDVYTKAQANALLDEKANASDVYTKTQTDTLLDAKQDILTAGAGITITDSVIATNIINDTLASRTTVWSSQEVKDRFDAISGSARIVVIASLPASPEENTLYYVGSASPYHIWLRSSGVTYDMGTTEIDLTGYYTKTETDTLLSAKANANDVYTKTQADTLINAKQDTITDSVITNITDSDSLSDLNATAKTNKRITMANIFAWLLTKLTTTITNLSTHNQIPSAKAVYDLSMQDTRLLMTDAFTLPNNFNGYGYSILKGNVLTLFLAITSHPIFTNNGWVTIATVKTDRTIYIPSGTTVTYQWFSGLFEKNSNYLGAAFAIFADKTLKIWIDDNHKNGAQNDYIRLTCNIILE